MPRRLRVRFPGIYRLTANAGTYALTGNVAALGQGGSSGGGGTGGLDWAQRSSAAGVFRAFGYDSSSQLGYDTSQNGGFLGSTADTSYGYGSVTAGTPTIDLTTDVDGTGGSLKFTFPPNSGASAAGNWATHFSDDNTLTFGPNSKFYFQFRYRHDGMLESTAATEGVKIAFIDSSTSVGNSNTPLTIVITTYGQAGTFFVYVYPSYPGNPANNNTFGLVVLHTEFPGSTPTIPLFQIPANEWITFTGSLELRDVMTASPYNSYHIDGTLIIDAIRADGTKTRVCEYGPGWYDAFNNFSYIGFPWKLATQTSPTWTEFRFGTLEFLPYTTSKDASVTNPEYHMWYDQAILSTQPIADPGTTTFPAWRQALNLYEVTNISATNDTCGNAHYLAGYYKDGWREGAQQDATQNLLAWGSGTLAPDLGNYGSMVFMALGHEQETGATIFRFDLETAQWKTPIGPPQKWRQTSDNSFALPDAAHAGAEVWYDPTNAAGKFNADAYTWNGYTGMSAIINEYYSTGKSYPWTGVVATSGFNLYGDSYQYWPPTYGYCYTANAGSTGARYGSICVVPQSAGGEAAGSLVTAFTWLPHVWGSTGDLWEPFFNYAPTHGEGYAWRFGFTSQAWLGPSTNQQPLGSARGSTVTTAFSAKHGKVFCTGGSANGHALAYYDPATNSLGTTNSEISFYGAGGPFPPNGLSETNGACVTDGHVANLFITLGATPSSVGTPEVGLFVYDLDEVMNNPSTSPVVVNYMILSSTSALGDATANRYALISPNLALPQNDGVNTFGAAGYGAVSWSKKRQRLFVWQTNTAYTFAQSAPNPSPASIYGVYRAGLGYMAPLHGANLQVITIPDNWKTDPWVCQVIPLTLKSGVTGTPVTISGSCYGKVQWSDECDCLIIAENPTALPIQAVRVW